jgi:hypothetical protein
MVGRALVLSRLHTIGKMGQLAARCMGNQLCRNMGRWLVQNPDCMIEAGSLAVSYGISGSPNVLLPEGAAAASLDAGFLAKECLDRTPGSSNRFTHGNSSSSLDPPHPSTSRPDLRRNQVLGRQGEVAAGIPKNTERIDSLSGTANYRVPDGLDHDAKVISEVKNVGKPSYTAQIRDFDLYAQQNGYTFELWLRPGVKPSGPLQEAIDAGRITRRDIP